MAGTTFQYWNGSWTTESDTYVKEIVHKLNSPKTATITITNANNANDATYSLLQEVRIVEDTTSLVLFRGKIESIRNPYDPRIGQTIVLGAKDNLQELAHQRANASFTGNTHSAIIDSILASYTYSGDTTIDTTNATKFTTSAVSSSTYPIVNAPVYDYTNSGKTVLRAIQEIAQQDPYDSTPSGYGYDFYLDSDLDFNYFKRGTKPAAPIATNGLSIIDGGTEGNKIRAMMLGSIFTREGGRDLATRVRIEWTDADDLFNSVQFRRFNITEVTNSFSVGDVVQGATSGSTATVAAVSTGRLVVYNWSANFTIGETLFEQGDTPAYDPQATLDSMPEDDIKMNREIILRLHEVSQATDVYRKADELFEHNTSSVVRGNVQIVGYPFHNPGAGWELVNAGEVVRVTNSTQGIDLDMLVTNIRYVDGPGQYYASIEVLGEDNGEGYRVFHGDSTDLHIAESNASVTSQIGPQPKNWMDFTLTWPSGDSNGDSTIGFLATAQDAFSWDAGLVTWSDGSSQSFVQGTSGAITGINYVYGTSGSTTLNVTTNFNDVLGTGKFWLATALPGQDAVTAGGTNELCGIISATTPGILMDQSTGSLAANQLSAFSADLGMITAGAIVVEGNVGDTFTPGAAFDGVVLQASGIKGYSAGALSARMDATAAGGFDVFGGDGTTIGSNFRIYNAAGTIAKLTLSTDGTDLYMKTFGTGGDIHIGATGKDVLPVGTGQNLGSLTEEPWAQVITDLVVLNETGGGIDYVGLNAPSVVTTSYSLTFPAAPPVGANYILESDASGVLAWIATPPSAVSSITNNTNNNVLTATGGTTINGEANLTFDGTTVVVGNGVSRGIQTGAGTVTTPAYGFSAFTGDGFFLNGSADLQVTLGGVAKFKWQTANTISVSHFLPSGPGTYTLGNTTNEWSIGWINKVYAEGSGTVPAFTFNGDTDTGMFNPSGDLIRFSTGSSQRMDVGFNLGGHAKAEVYITGGLEVDGDIDADSDIIAYSGVRIGADSGNNEIFNATQGAASTTLYIGNASINVTSDARIKSNIRTTQRNALDIVNQLQVVDFEWNDPTDTVEYGKNYRGTYTGMIAQDVVDIVPWIINDQGGGKDCETCRAYLPCGDHTEPWMVEYEHLVPTLVKAIQELKARIEELEK